MVALAAAVLALPAMSVKRPAATSTVIVPATFGVGVTSSVACAPLSRVNAPGVPPDTTMSVASKLTPTSSSKTKVKVTGPVAAGADTSLAIVSVGAFVSGTPGAGAPTGGGGGSASPPPQPASAAQASTRAPRAWIFVGCVMAEGLGLRFFGRSATGPPAACRAGGRPDESAFIRG